MKVKAQKFVKKEKRIANFDFESKYLRIKAMRKHIFHIFLANVLMQKIPPNPQLTGLGARRNKLSPFFFAENCQIISLYKFLKTC